MKAASLSDIKKELIYIEPNVLQDLCLRLAKYKVENKELLTYLLFEANDESAYIENVKQDIDEQFTSLPSKNNLYLAKKSVRKILRLANKQIKYSGIKKTEIQIRIYFLTQFRESGIKFEGSAVLVNLYNQQIKKIHTALSKLPEDLQYDYQEEVEALSLF